MDFYKKYMVGETLGKLLSCGQLLIGYFGHGLFIPSLTDLDVEAHSIL